jgi:hypothetical protein
MFVRSRTYAAIAALLLSWLLETPALAQFDDPAVPATKTKGKTKSTREPKQPKKPRQPEKVDEPSVEALSARGVQPDTAEKQLWRCGVEIRAVGGPCAGLFGTISIPTDWPEQTVRIHKEDITPNVRKTAYRTIDQGVKQMTIAIPNLVGGELARSVVIFEVERYSLKPPPDTTIFILPTRPPAAVKKHLGTSPFIESPPN